MQLKLGNFKSLRFFHCQNIVNFHRNTKNNAIFKPDAIMEFRPWPERRGAVEVGGKIRGALQTVDKNEEFIKITLAALMTSE
ncbi:hypothetical protein LOY55_10860 [Pseudomonas sp. B21-040]|uniref:hypothetical protein n=1 Tax=Pseudomonas sp. B21-040 TaxID=2895486 RepID=UPI00215FC441|nr:hypothetical protein [Pseudomonas sp. B21-040]UVL42560.1 hypothetical protein LOY55_10860 [Pseudomonas sp. B21-040]